MKTQTIVDCGNIQLLDGYAVRRNHNKVNICAFKDHKKVFEIDTEKFFYDKNFDQKIKNLIVSLNQLMIDDVSLEVTFNKGELSSEFWFCVRYEKGNAIFQEIQYPVLESIYFAINKNKNANSSFVEDLSCEYQEYEFAYGFD